MNITIKIGDIVTAKDFITHLKVLQGQVLQEMKRLNTTELSPNMQLDDSNCYGWHEVNFEPAQEGQTNE